MADPTLNFPVDFDVSSAMRSSAKAVDYLQKKLDRISIGRNATKNINNLPLGKISGDLDKFEQSLAASNARVLAFGATTGIIYGVSQAFRTLLSDAIAVEKAIANIQVVLRATESELSKFSKDLFEVANNTGQSFETAATAAAEFARQGIGMARTLEAVESALILTRLTGLKAEESVKALTAAVNTFNNEGLTYAEVVNRMANVDTAFAVSSEDLVKGLQRVGSTAVDAGVGVNELLALITSLQQTTARGGSIIGNGLKSIFTRLQRSRVQDALREIGIATQESNGQFRSATAVLKDVASAYDTLTDSQKAQISELTAGVFQINTLKGLFADLGKEVSIFDQALQIAENTSNEAFQKNAFLNNTLATKINEARNSLAQFNDALGGLGVRTTAGDILSVLTKGLKGLTNSIASDEGGVFDKVGESFVKGIVKAISGPGLAIVAKGLLNLSKNVLVDTARGGKSILFERNERALRESISKDMEQRNQKLNKYRQLEEQVNILLQSASKEIRNKLKNTNDLIERQKLFNRLIKEETSQRAAQAKLIRQFIVSSGQKTITGGTPNKAEGHVPTFSTGMAMQSEAIAIANGVGGATRKARPVPKKLRLSPGRPQQAVVNTDEYIIRDYMGTRADAVFNKDMVRQAGGVSKLNQFGRVEKVFAGGTVPDFSTGLRGMMAKGVGRIATNLISPYSYNIYNQARYLKGRGLKSILSSIIKDQPIHGFSVPEITQQIIGRRQSPGTARALNDDSIAVREFAFRKMFGLKPRLPVGHLIRENKDSVSFRRSPLRDDIGYTVGGLDWDTKQAVANHPVMGNYVLKRLKGGYSYEDTWDLMPHKGEERPSLRGIIAETRKYKKEFEVNAGRPSIMGYKRPHSSLLATLLRHGVSKIASPVTFKGKISDNENYIAGGVIPSFGLGSMLLRSAIKSRPLINRVGKHFMKPIGRLATNFIDSNEYTLASKIETFKDAYYPKMGLKSNLQGTASFIRDIGGALFKDQPSQMFLTGISSLLPSDAAVGDFAFRKAFGLRSPNARYKRIGQALLKGQSEGKFLNNSGVGWGDPNEYLNQILSKNVKRNRDGSYRLIGDSVPSFMGFPRKEGDTFRLMDNSFIMNKYILDYAHNKPDVRRRLMEGNMVKYPTREAAPMALRGIAKDRWDLDLNQNEMRLLELGIQDFRLRDIPSLMKGDRDLLSTGSLFSRHMLSGLMNPIMFKTPMKGHYASGLIPSFSNGLAKFPKGFFDSRIYRQHMPKGMEEAIFAQIGGRAQKIHGMMRHAIDRSGRRSRVTKEEAEMLSRLTSVFLPRFNSVDFLQHRNKVIPRNINFTSPINDIPISMLNNLPEPLIQETFKRGGGRIGLMKEIGKDPGLFFKTILTRGRGGITEPPIGPNGKPLDVLEDGTRVFYRKRDTERISMMSNLVFANGRVPSGGSRRQEAADIGKWIKSMKDEASSLGIKIGPDEVSKISGKRIGLTSTRLLAQKSGASNIGKESAFYKKLSTRMYDSPLAYPAKIAFDLAHELGHAKQTGSMSILEKEKDAWNRALSGVPESLKQFMPQFRQEASLSYKTYDKSGYKFALGFMPNFSNGNLTQLSPMERKIKAQRRGKLLGQGAFGSFYQLRSGIGVKRFKSWQDPLDIEFEYKLSKFLGENNIIPGVGAPKVVGSLARSLAKKRIGKEVVTDPTLKQAFSEFSESDSFFSGRFDNKIAYIVRQALRKKGVSLSDMHGSNATINKAGVAFFKKNAYRLKGVTVDDIYNKDYSGIINEMSKAGGKISIIDAGDEMQSSINSSRLFDSTGLTFASGFIPDKNKTPFGLTPNMAKGKKVPFSNERELTPGMIALWQSKDPLEKRAYKILQEHGFDSYKTKQGIRALIPYLGKDGETGFARPLIKNDSLKEKTRLDEALRNILGYSGGYIPNMANGLYEIGSLFGNALVDFNGEKATISGLATIKDGIGLGGLLYEDVMGSIKNQGVKTVFGDLLPQDRKPRENTPLSELKAKYPQVGLAKFAKESAFGFGDKDFVIRGGKFFKKDLAKNASAMLSALRRGGGTPTMRASLAGGSIPSFNQLSNRELVKILRRGGAMGEGAKKILQSRGVFDSFNKARGAGLRMSELSDVGLQNAIDIEDTAGRGGGTIAQGARAEIGKRAERLRIRKDEKTLQRQSILRENLNDFEIAFQALPPNKRTKKTTQALLNQYTKGFSQKEIDTVAGANFLKTRQKQATRARNDVFASRALNVSFAASAIGEGIANFAGAPGAGKAITDISTFGSLGASFGGAPGLAIGAGIGLFKTIGDAAKAADVPIAKMAKTTQQMASEFEKANNAAAGYLQAQSSLNKLLQDPNATPQDIEQTLRQRSLATRDLPTDVLKKVAGETDIIKIQRVLNSSQIERAGMMQSAEAMTSFAARVDEETTGLGSIGAALGFTTGLRPKNIEELIKSGETAISGFNFENLREKAGSFGLKRQRLDDAEGALSQGDIKPLLNVAASLGELPEQAKGFATTLGSLAEDVQKRVTEAMVKRIKSEEDMRKSLEATKRQYDSTLSTLQDFTKISSNISRRESFIDTARQGAVSRFGAFASAYSQKNISSSSRNLLSDVSSSFGIIAAGESKKTDILEPAQEIGKEIISKINDPELQRRLQRDFQTSDSSELLKRINDSIKEAKDSGASGLDEIQKKTKELSDEVIKIDYSTRQQLDAMVIQNRILRSIESKQKFDALIQKIGALDPSRFSETITGGLDAGRNLFNRTREQQREDKRRAAEATRTRNAGPLLESLRERGENAKAFLDSVRAQKDLGVDVSRYDERVSIARRMSLQSDLSNLIVPILQDAIRSTSEDDIEGRRRLRDAGYEAVSGGLSPGSLKRAENIIISAIGRREGNSRLKGSSNALKDALVAIRALGQPLRGNIDYTRAAGLASSNSEQIKTIPERMAALFRYGVSIDEETAKPKATEKEDSIISSLSKLQEKIQSGASNIETGNLINQIKKDLSGEGISKEFKTMADQLLIGFTSLLSIDENKIFKDRFSIERKTAYEEFKASQKDLDPATSALVSSNKNIVDSNMVLEKSIRDLTSNISRSKNIANLKLEEIPISRQIEQFEERKANLLPFAIARGSKGTTSQRVQSLKSATMAEAALEINGINSNEKDLYRIINEAQNAVKSFDTERFPELSNRLRAESKVLSALDPSSGERVEPFIEKFASLLERLSAIKVDDSIPFSRSINAATSSSEIEKLDKLLKTYAEEQRKMLDESIKRLFEDQSTIKEAQKYLNQNVDGDVNVSFGIQLEGVPEYLEGPAKKWALEVFKEQIKFRNENPTLYDTQ